jgi:phytoene synthase
MTCRGASQTSAAAVMAASGKTFFQAAGLLPRAVRGRVISLYAFCRYVDDLADESTQSVEDRSRQLHRLQHALAGAQNEEPTQPWTALANSLQLSPLSRWAASELVGAARADLCQEQPKHERALISYAFGVAGTVGLMMAEVLGARKQGTRAAVELGIAMQLSNIARDVAQDFRAGRVYLPASWIGRAEVRRALTGHDESAQELLRASTLRLLKLADAYYRSAFRGFWTLPWRVRWSILAAAMCYREIGVSVGRDVERSWRRRTVVPRWRKLILIAAAAVRMLLPVYWKARPLPAVSSGSSLLDQLPPSAALAETIP